MEEPSVNNFFSAPLTPPLVNAVSRTVFVSISAAFVSLRIILLVEMLGLERLTNAFGFLLLFQGLAFVVSPPILGTFADYYESSSPM